MNGPSDGENSCGETAVDARYEQIFEMAYLAVEPQLADARHAFEFEGHRILIKLPSLPAKSPSTQSVLLSPPARVSSWRSDTLEPLRVEIYRIILCIEELRFSIPLAAEVHPHINMALFNTKQRLALDDQSDQLHFLAGRALGYWLRVMWWRTGFHMIDRLPGIVQGSFDGGALVNATTGTKFYVPGVARTAMIFSPPVVRSAHWAAIDLVLRAGEVPPVWHDYIASAHRRMASGDSLAAILDLAVAAEARIRTFLDDDLPSEITKGIRRMIRLQNLNNILTNWRSFGLPDFAELPNIRALIEVRNGIMHSGKEARTNADFFKIAAEAVARLLAAF
jgi:hypothetical protein